MKMNKNILIAGILLAGLIFVQSPLAPGSFAEAPANSAKFERYRAALNEAFQIDIRQFKDRLKGGQGDGKAVTDFELGELVEGIKVEREHTDDNALALELSMDHLERVPDYYTRLTRMECEAHWDRVGDM